MRRYLLIAALAATATLATAQDMPRSDRFEAALAEWLADEDAAAIPALSGLAQDGEVAARLLLGTIEHMGEVQTDWSLALSRAERMEYYRQQGGLSGVSWLGALDDLQIVALLRDLDDVNTAPQTVMRLDEMGEGRLAREGLRLMARREQYADARAVLDELPGYDHVAAALVPGIEVSDRPAPHPLAGAWCQATCPAVATCEAALGESIDTWSLGSPLTALISEETWAASVKGLRSVERFAALRDRGGDIMQACEAT